MRKTIKDFLFSIIRENDGHIEYDDVTRLIKSEFPHSKWDKTQWAWYKNKITTSNGKYYNLFPEEIRNNLSGRNRIFSNPLRKFALDLGFTKEKNNTSRKELQSDFYEFSDFSKLVEKNIAIELGKVCHHIHPLIVRKIVESNKEFRNEFKEYCGHLDLNTYFYEGSDCIFPGVRRTINKEKIGNWKNNINSVDNTILNDNTFPRHIWAFLSMNRSYEGKMWSASGLANFELAHIFGHKIDEKKLERKVFSKYDESKLPHAYFTSASNVVLIPNGLMKPTDKFETVKIAFYKRHIDLYGNNFNAEKDFNEDFVPDWYNEIMWLEPALPNQWERKIDNLLDYRKRILRRKYYETCNL